MQVFAQSPLRTLVSFNIVFQFYPVNQVSRFSRVEIGRRYTPRHTLHSDGDLLR